MKNINFQIIISQYEDGIFLAQCPTITGCHSQGDTYEEAESNIKEAIELCLQVAEYDAQRALENENNTSDSSFFCQKLSTTVDRQTMERVYRDLDNPPAGTASLQRLLQKIECEKK